MSLPAPAPSTPAATPPVSSPSPPAPPPSAPAPSSPSSSSPPPSATSPPPASSPPPSSPLPSSPPSPVSATPPATSASSPPPPSTPTSTRPTSSPSPPTSSSSSPPPPPASLSPPPPPKASTTTPTTPTTTSTTTPSTSSSSSSSQVSGPALIGIGVAGLIAASVVVVLLYCLCCKKKKKNYYPGEYYGPPGGPPAHYKDSYYGADMRQQQWCSPSSTGSEVLIKMPPPPPVPPSPRNGYDPVPPNGGSAGLGNSKSWFTYEELATATGGFSRSNLLGQGGFGSVYKGVLSDGQVVAVKQLKAGGGQGEKEFRAEVEIISRVHHRHLVSLVGYCIAESQRLLVYDYVPNGTLEYHLHGRKGGPVMDWPTRLKIACGAARGLAYLHEDCHPRIIHRDIKSSNILLDNNFEAQVSDFGLAKLTSDTNTHVTTRVMGTFGYLAPEYASSGKLTEKSDVFSFGVVLLELLSGRKPVDQSQPQGEESLVEWARLVLKQEVNGEEDLHIVADPALDGAYDSKEMMRMVEAAAACIRHSANKRPRMGQVVRALEDDASFSDLTRGLKPGHSSAYGSSFASSEYENTSYTAEMRKFRRVALESQELGSEASGNTSEYGMNPSVSSSEYQTSREVDRNAFMGGRGSKPRSARKTFSTSSSNEFS